MWSSPTADDEFAHVASLWTVPANFAAEDGNGNGNGNTNTANAKTFFDGSNASGSAGCATPTSGPADAPFTVTEGGLLATPEGAGRSRATPPSLTTPGGRPRLCKFHSSGGCAKGAECPFSHDLNVRASTSAAAKAGFVFVTGVANIAGAENIESPQGGDGANCGLNPTAQAFSPDAPDCAVDGPQAYFGASEHLIGNPQQPLGGGYDDDHHHQPQYHRGQWSGPASGYVSNAATPPTYTQRRRVPYQRGALEEVAAPLDFATRQQQALRPPLELPGSQKLGVSPKPTERPRPPLQPQYANHNNSGGYGSHHQHHGEQQYGGHGYDAAPYYGGADGHDGYGHGAAAGYSEYSDHHNHHGGGNEERFVPWRGFH